MIIKIMLNFFLFSLLQTTVFAAEPAPRWYSAEQQTQGKIIFQKNCAVCHGDKAQATSNWKETNAEGKYPPPPLNGSAHAWHHSLNGLRKSVQDGGQKIGGLMPSFEQILSVSDRDNAIAFFQSQWSDELYLKWSNNFNVASIKARPSINYEEIPVLQPLLNRLNAPKIDSFKRVANNQLYQVVVKDQTIYLTRDGRFAIIGNLIDLDTGKNMTPTR